MVTIVALKFVKIAHFPFPKNFTLFVPTLLHGASRVARDRKPKTNDQFLPSPILCVRGTRWERERERERERKREREKWRHHCRAKIGNELIFTFPCQKFVQLAISLHFPLPPKFALFVSWSPFTLPVSPFLNCHHCGAETRNEFTLSIAKTFHGPLCSESLKCHEPCDEWSKTQYKWTNPGQSYIALSIEKKMSQINTKIYWKWRKRLCVRWLRVINLLWENLQIAKHKSVRRTNAFLICALRSVDFLRWCLSPERNLTHNLFLFPIVFGIIISSSGASQTSSFWLTGRVSFPPSESSCDLVPPWLHPKQLPPYESTFHTNSSKYAKKHRETKKNCIFLDICASMLQFATLTGYLHRRTNLGIRKNSLRKLTTGKLSHGLQTAHHRGR